MTQRKEYNDLGISFDLPDGWLVQKPNPPYDIGIIRNKDYQNYPFQECVNISVFDREGRALNELIDSSIKKSHNTHYSEIHITADDEKNLMANIPGRYVEFNYKDDRYGDMQGNANIVGLGPKAVFIEYKAKAGTDFFSKFKDQAAAIIQSFNFSSTTA
jgi:hypothetical protein